MTAEPGLNAVSLSWSLVGARDAVLADDGTVIEPATADVTAIYVVTATENEPDRIERIDAAVDGATITGLKNGVAYGFTVYAATADGRSVAEGPVSATPTTGVEGEVAGLIVEFTGDVAVGQTDVPGAEQVTRSGWR